MGTYTFRMVDVAKRQVSFHTPWLTAMFISRFDYCCCVEGCFKERTAVWAGVVPEEGYVIGHCCWRGIVDARHGSSQCTDVGAICGWYADRRGWQLSEQKVGVMSIGGMSMID